MEVEYGPVPVVVKSEVNVEAPPVNDPGPVATKSGIDARPVNDPGPVATKSGIDARPVNDPGPVATKSGIDVESPSLTWPPQVLNVHAVQCFRCGKYRCVPEKRNYEEIREQILSNPWECEFASQWTIEQMNCDVPDEFTSPEFVLIFDKPAIPASPPQWERKCFLRKPGSTKFADVYYYPPNGGPRIKSKKDITRYFEKFPGSLPPDFDVSRRTSFAIPQPPPGLWVKKELEKISEINKDGKPSENIAVSRTANDSKCDMVDMAESKVCEEEFFDCNVKDDADEETEVTSVKDPGSSAAETLPRCEQSMIWEFSG